MACMASYKSKTRAGYHNPFGKLANHINNSLTKLTFCGNSKSQSDRLDSDYEDEEGWRFLMV
jgi:hypothetical protein